MYTFSLVVFLLATFYFWRLTYQKESIVRRMAAEREQVSFIIDSLSDGLIEFDNEFSVIRINRQAEVLLGVKAEDIISKKITPELSRNAALKSLVTVSFPALGGETKIPKEKEGVDIHEISVEFPKTRRLRIFTVPKITKEKKTGFLKIIRDITKEELISQSKSDLVAAVAHQLRTPLSGVKWMIKALMDGDYGTMNEKQIKILQEGYKTNAYTISLVSDILDISKIETGRVDYKFVKVDLIEFLKGIIVSFGEKQRTSGVRIETDFKIDKLEAEIDMDRVRIAITNIIDNAVNYSESGQLVKITTEKDNEFVKISIEDHGIGIPREDQFKIFKKFFRAENAKKKVAQGTGLGLIMAKSIARGHGGDIDFLSQEGRGTTFFVKLPLSQKEVTWRASGHESEVKGI